MFRREGPAREPRKNIFLAAYLAVTAVGATWASLLLESDRPARLASRYALALLVEGALLGSFVFVAGLSRASHPLALDAQAGLLCAAMGMQNSLVTRLSGAVVRTTHLTGVVTDLGIEAARWYRWHRTKRNGQPPSRDRASLLSTIVVSFIGGAVAGAVLTFRASRWAMCLPSTMILLASAYAFAQANSDERA